MSLVITTDNLVPDTGGTAAVDNGFELDAGASDGCRGGVASWKSSLSTYVPSLAWNWYSGPIGCFKEFELSVRICEPPEFDVGTGIDGYALVAGRTLPGIMFAIIQSELIQDIRCPDDP